MPSYIELDKNASFPNPSGTNKVIFGVNANGQTVSIDSSGSIVPSVSASYATTASYAMNAGGGGGGGTGLQIPKPIVYASKYPTIAHIFGQDLSQLGNGTGLPGAITDSWNSEQLKLTYQTGDLSFLQYNPKYFLFVYGANARMGHANNSHPNTRINNLKYGKYYSHPTNVTGSSPGPYTPISTYRNFSNDSSSLGTFSSSFSYFATEWNVNTGSGQPTVLTGFNPLRFYKVISVGWRGQEFFPMLCNNGAPDVTVTTYKSKKFNLTPHISGSITTSIAPRVNLYVKFAIVVQDPTNTARYIIGPMSDAIKIFPKAGYFNDNITTASVKKYYYAWATKVV